jgi:hypothetical protein
MTKRTGLWDNIRAKRERIKHGSGEHMRKPGSKNAPSLEALKRANEEYDYQLDESGESGLASKSKASGISIGTLRKVYRRGIAAWNSGHRPGTTPQQWGMARVNSYITKGKTYHTADKDLHEMEESTLPKKYTAGLSQSTIAARTAHFAKTSKMSDRDPNAYAPAPGDATAKTKESKYTKKYREMYGEEKVQNSNATIFVKQHPKQPDSYIVHHIDDPDKELDGHLKKGDTEHKETINDFKTLGHKVVNLTVHEANNPETSINAHKQSKHFKTPETAELQSNNPNDSDSRFDSTDSAVRIYKKATPGQTTKEVKKVVKEALYHGHEVPLNKPMRGDVKKSKVYVRDPKTGNIKKVNFGDKHLSIKKDQPARKRSYCARSSGQGNLTNKTSANYWSRRAWEC